MMNGKKYHHLINPETGRPINNTLLSATIVCEDGTLADKFRERVMFPIQSVSGRTIAFSGRTLKADNPAKYVNSPDTEIYRKSNILFGIYFAKSDISRANECP